MKKYILAVLVDNKPGVLTHVSGLISRRAFNIESISAGYTEERDVTRINIEVDSIVRELVLLKVKAQKETLSDIRNIVDIFRGKIVDVSPENVVIELTGSRSKIDAICEMLAEFQIIEIARTGAIALSRGPIPVKNM